VDKQIICLVGPIASGKGTVIKILETMGYVCYGTKTPILEEAAIRKLPTDRKTLQDLGGELKLTYGEDVLARRISERFNPNHKFIVIDNIRCPEEVIYFQENYPTLTIAITASQETRYQRCLERARGGDVVTWDDFVEADNRELYGVKGQSGQRVLETMALANLTINNEINELSILEASLRSCLESYSSFNPELVSHHQKER
jgi:dephospho-CoA kinase